MKRRIKLTEQDIVRMVKRAVNEVKLNESLKRLNESDHRYDVTIFDGGWNHLYINDLNEINEIISPTTTYVDVTLSSMNDGDDVNGLVMWDGEGGYWSNIAYGTMDDIFPLDDEKTYNGKQQRRIKQIVLSKRKNILHTNESLDRRVKKSIRESLNKMNEDIEC